MRIIKNIVPLCIIILLTTTFCKKEPVINPVLKADTTYNIKGLYVLNQGLMDYNNSTLTYLSFTDTMAITDYFNMQNGVKLGDTGNDMAIYGNKMYIVVEVSSQVDVVNPFNGKIIKQIPFLNGVQPRVPQNITFSGSRAFVCSFDGTVAVIDTATLTIIKYITVGSNPDGIAVANNKVYVSNSGGLNFPNYDSTISVIDIPTLTVIKQITVRINPSTIVPDAYGDLYVISIGNYSNINMCLQIIDSQTDELKYTFPGLQALNLTISGDTAYVYYYDYNTSSGSQIMLVNVKNETVISNNFITDGTVINTIYGITVDKQSNNVYVCDARGFVNTGDVVCFNKQGQKKYSFKAGLNPCKIAFLSETNITAVSSKYIIKTLKQ